MNLLVSVPWHTPHRTYTKMAAAASSSILFFNSLYRVRWNAFSKFTQNFMEKYHTNNYGHVVGWFLQWKHVLLIFEKRFFFHKKFVIKGMKLILLAMCEWANEWVSECAVSVGIWGCLCHAIENMTFWTSFITRWDFIKFLLFVDYFIFLFQNKSTQNNFHLRELFSANMWSQSGWAFCPIQVNVWDRVVHAKYVGTILWIFTTCFLSWTEGN